MGGVHVNMSSHNVQSTDESDSIEGTNCIMTVLTFRLEFHVFYDNRSLQIVSQGTDCHFRLSIIVIENIGVAM